MNRIFRRNCQRRSSGKIKLITAGLGTFDVTTTGLTESSTYMKTPWSSGQPPTPAVPLFSAYVPDLRICGPSRASRGGVCAGEKPQGQQLVFFCSARRARGVGKWSPEEALAEMGEFHDLPRYYRFSIQSEK